MTVRYRIVSTIRYRTERAGEGEAKANETPEHGAHLPVLANPRVHPRLQGRGRVGSAHPGRPRRLPPAGAEVLLRRRFAPRLPRLPRRSRALGDPMEARAAARLGRPGRWPRFPGADAPRPVASGPARRPVRPGSPRAPLQAAL